NVWPLLSSRTVAPQKLTPLPKGLANSSRMTRLPRRMPSMSGCNSSRSCVSGLRSRKVCSSSVPRFLSLLIAVPRCFTARLRASPCDRRLRAVAPQDGVEFPRLGGLRRFDDHVHLERLKQRLAHAGDVETAVDRLLREPDGECVVVSDATRDLQC